jgi:ankyrin repeat protein
LQALDKYGYTALHHAVLSKDLQTVLMCLPRKSPIAECTAVDHVASDTLTALHIACKLGLDRIAHAIVHYASWMVRCY